MTSQPTESGPSNYPGRICNECGIQHGARQKQYLSWHTGHCGWCHQVKAVTDPRDYGYPPAPEKDDD